MELNHFRAYDQEIATTNTKICQLQQDVAAIEHDCGLCEQRLKALRCAEGLANLEGLGPKSTCVKWSTCFTDNKEDNNKYRSTQ
jgi:hypothetical protein